MKVSIVIPVFNAAPFIEQAVHSALIQPEVAEVILVDDGSTDGSYEICQKLAFQDNRIRLLTHPNHENRRAGASRNLGIRQARYEFISFLDADDYYVENRFAEAKKVFEDNPDADGTYDLHGLYYESEQGKKLFNRHRKTILTSYSLEKDVLPEDLFEQFVLGKTWFSFPTLTLRRRSFAPDLYMNEQLFQGQDTDFSMKWILKRRLYPANIACPVMYYRVHNNNTTHNLMEACKYKHRTYLPWVKRIRTHNWSKKTNRRLIRYLLVGVSCHNNVIIRFIRKSFYLKLFLIRHPWIIRKLI